MKQRYALAAVMVMVLAGIRLDLRAQPGPGWAGLSPFTEVNVDGDAAEVVYQGQKYELVSVQGIATKDIMDFCRGKYEKRWEERFATDIVDVRGAMGKKSDGTLQLVLRYAKKGAVLTINRAPMSRENR